MRYRVARRVGRISEVLQSMAGMKFIVTSLYIHIITLAIYDTGLEKLTCHTFTRKSYPKRWMSLLSPMLASPVAPRLNKAPEYQLNVVEGVKDESLV